MASVMEGPIKQTAAAELGVAIEGRAQGASGLAQLIVAGSIRPDVFISITPGPMQVVIHAGKARKSVPLARTEMVIAYSPQTRFADNFKSKPWYEVLQSPGLRFGRTDPVTDPQGRNILFVLQLAADFYHQPDLKQRIAGPDINPAQIFAEPSVQSRLQSGELDAASAYKIQPEAFHLPYVTLPEQINLGSVRLASEYQRVSITVQGRTYRPEPLVYYAAVLKDAADPTNAERFVSWLQEGRGQSVLRQYRYDPA
ncbi:MAG: substrate-binding domain-containing protein [Acidobacteriaceae bacterium]|nr:substrate-binding domain-containing protein [Acidobacteriaceae bacterium]